MHLSPKMLSLALTYLVLKYPNEQNPLSNHLSLYRQRVCDLCSAVSGLEYVGILFRGQFRGITTESTLGLAGCMHLLPRGLFCAGGGTTLSDDALASV